MAYIIDVQGFELRERPMIVKVVTVVECGVGAGVDPKKVREYVLFPHKPESELTPDEVATVRRAERYHGYPFCGGFCTLAKVRRQIRNIVPAGSNVYVNGELTAHVLETTFGFAQRNVSVWTTSLFTTEPAIVSSRMIVLDLKQRYDYERASSFKRFSTLMNMA